MALTGEIQAPRSPEEGRLLAQRLVTMKAELEKTRQRRLYHETAETALDAQLVAIRAERAGLQAQHGQLQAKHENFQSQIKENLQQIKEIETKRDAELQALSQEEAEKLKSLRTKSLNLVTRCVAQTFLGNVPDSNSKEAQQKAVASARAFLEVIKNDPLEGPIKPVNGKVELTATALDHIGNDILQKNPAWKTLDLSAARGTIDKEALKGLLGKYTGIVNVVLGKGQEALQSDLSKYALRKLNVTIREN